LAALDFSAVALSAIYKMLISRFALPYGIPTEAVRRSPAMYPASTLPCRRKMMMERWRMLSAVPGQS
jgi:hypothetical protein